MGPLTRCLRRSAQFPTLFQSPFLLKPPRFNLVRPNPTFIFSKNLHNSSRLFRKLYMDSENLYAHSILPPIQKFQPSWNSPKKIATVQDLNQFLDQNWRSSNASTIVEAFEKVKDIIIANEITLSDPRFDKLVDGLMDHCEKLTDEDLLRLLYTLLEYPPCDAHDSHNFYDVWCCLDDICCWKMGNWSFSKLYTFAEVWYKWNLGRMSDYMFEALNRIVDKPRRLSKNMLVYTFFYLNVHRRKDFPFEIEQGVVEKLGEFSDDELAVIAMGYFKTITKIKSPEIVSAMIKAVQDNVETMNEISLTALLKAIRLSQRLETVEEIPPMLDKVTQHLSRFSNMALLHVALAGTTLQIKHEESLRQCAQRLVDDITEIRVKDIERILAACSMFTVDTTPSLYSKAFEEIHKENRRNEFILYHRCLPSTLHYLSIEKVYSYSLMNELLNDDFINDSYGKSPKTLPRDLFSLEMCIEIECPDYAGNRLSPFKKYKAAKWLTEYTPTPTQRQRLSFADKLYLNIAEGVTSVVGEERLVRHDHVLPHFCKSDMIVCQDRTSGEFVEPFGFENYVLGDVKRPVDVEKYKWYAVVVMTPNVTIRGTCLPLGAMRMKERQLKTIGYHPVFVYTSTFTNLPTSEKTNFLRSQLQ